MLGPSFVCAARYVADSARVGEASFCIWGDEAEIEGDDDDRRETRRVTPPSADSSSTSLLIFGP